MAIGFAEGNGDIAPNLPVDTDTAMRKSYFVYILQCGDGSLYTGITTDVERRLSAHNNGKGAKYTRSHRPVTIVYREECKDKSAALKREAAIKKMTREEKLKLIEKATQ